MRRRDREVVGLEHILAILDKCEIIRLGLSTDNKPYIVPMNFAYEVIDDQVTIYLHCAPEGRKIDMIAQNHNVCFEADCAYRTLDAPAACEWAAEFESVIGEGTISIVAEETQKIHGLDLLMKRYGFVGKPQYQPNQLAAVTVLQIFVSTIAGKRKRKA